MRGCQKIFCNIMIELKFQEGEVAEGPLPDAPESPESDENAEEVSEPVEGEEKPSEGENE